MRPPETADAEPAPVDLQRVPDSSRIWVRDSGESIDSARYGVPSRFCRASATVTEFAHSGRPSRYGMRPTISGAISFE